MAGYNIVLNEGESADLILEWAAYDGVAFLATGWYKIVDAATDTIIKATTTFTECLTLTIPLTKAEVKITTEGNILEKKNILVCLTYSTSKQRTLQYDFYVRKLDFIEEDGVV